MELPLRNLKLKIFMKISNQRPLCKKLLELPDRMILQGEWISLGVSLGISLGVSLGVSLEVSWRNNFRGLFRITSIITLDKFGNFNKMRGKRPKISCSWFESRSRLSTFSLQVNEIYTSFCYSLIDETNEV